MITVELVVETPGTVPAVPWPVAITEDAFLRLSADTTPLQVGSVMQQLVHYNRIPGDTIEALIDRVIAANTLLLPGGILVANADGAVVIAPGCCSGLEDWQTWERCVNERSSPWGGHDPAPWIAYDGDMARLWADGGTDDARSESAIRDAGIDYVDVPAVELQRLLHQAGRALGQFAAPLRRWAEATTPLYADALVARLAEAFRIPLP